MPSTGSDNYKRSGRAYTIGRFKGPSYAYLETEYRFPILRNKLISGVCFLNFQTASDEKGNNMFSAMERGAGLGLRILFQKQSRSTLCIDFAKGQQVRYVLSRWEKNEAELLTTRIKTAGDIIKSFVSIGLQETMNLYNNK